jgi:hypothetical protein
MAPGDCRMYEQRYPEVDDVVMVQARRQALREERRRLRECATRIAVCRRALCPRLPPGG